jgi:hypothetical protein
VEVRNGFIVGIFNYCDRWCDACAFTSRCRLFADMAEMEATLDPALKALVEVPPLEPTPPPPPWLEELLEALDLAMHKAVDNGRPLERPLPPDHMRIQDRAHAYRARLHSWVRALELSKNNPADPEAVVRWFHTLIPAKIHRALRGLADGQPEDRDWPADYDGSAKVALVGIERSHTAWLDLVRRGVVTEADAAPFVADLVWLGESLERVFPNARAFIRPALDEQDEASRLLTRERS